MFIYTIRDYFELEKIFCKETNVIKDTETKYHYDLTEEENKRSNKKHQRHDKIVRDILNDKEEIAKIINKYINQENEIKKEDIEKYETRYITNNYQSKEADIVYKLKGKEVYFLIEHQTKVEKAMVYRMAEYSLEIMRSRIGNRIYKQTKYPRVIPIVIYTGKQKWTAERELSKIQEEYKIKNNKNQIQLGYNLIDIRKKEEAIEDDLLISKISILEKAESTEEILEIIDKISKKVTNEEKRTNLKKIVEYLLDDKILKEEIKEKLDVNLIMKITGLKKEQFMK